MIRLPGVIGLTGLYCAGKNRVAALMEQRGVPALDLDKLGHRALESEKARIVERFGGGVLAPDGSVDRRLLAEIVYKRRNAGDLAALEAIVHPTVNALADRWIEDAAIKGAAANGAVPDLCVVNAALIHKSAVFSRMRALVIVKAPFPIRLCRARIRDELPVGEIFRRFRIQSTFNSQYLAAKTDIYTIDNSGFSGSAANLEKRLDEILTRIREKL
ncbi:MAG: dephospho-CoA kinase [Treponema sp.]|jgi:dephospho-CoA kinase|nr:dephospho-CoA kinase [Treponema sp.]